MVPLLSPFSLLPLCEKTLVLARAHPSNNLMARGDAPGAALRCAVLAARRRICHGGSSAGINVFAWRKCVP